ncbi:hypothetical protein ACFV1H_17975 [Streptomyces virginiae]|uniref:hypothetical protein n=1 Tax=Streptomyces virginiae TaxID=1961 RepID=UPI0036B2BD96
MTGPEHYRKAEALLAVADDYEDDGAPQTARSRREEAQVHATLALAAATALIDETPRGDCFANYQAWQHVAGAGEGR